MPPIVSIFKRGQNVSCNTLHMLRHIFWWKRCLVQRQCPSCPFLRTLERTDHVLTWHFSPTCTYLIRIVTILLPWIRWLDTTKIVGRPWMLVEDLGRPRRFRNRKMTWQDRFNSRVKFANIELKVVPYIRPPRWTCRTENILQILKLLCDEVLENPILPWLLKKFYTFFFGGGGTKGVITPAPQLVTFLLLCLPPLYAVFPRLPCSVADGYCRIRRCERNMRPQELPTKIPCSFPGKFSSLQEVSRTI